MLANRHWLRTLNKLLCVLLCTGCYWERLCPDHISNPTPLNPSSPVIANHEISAVYCGLATPDMLRISNRSLEVHVADSYRSGRSRRWSPSVSRMALWKERLRGRVWVRSFEGPRRGLHSAATLGPWLKWMWRKNVVAVVWKMRVSITWGDIVVA